MFNNTTVKSPEDNRDWILESLVNYKDKLPKTVDYRPMLRAIRNQGSLGTCAAQTAACIKEYQEYKDVQFDSYFSPMFIYNNRVNQNTEGMYGRDVMTILSKKGVCPESYLSYGTIRKPEQIEPESYDIAANFKIKGYARVNTIRGVKAALFLYGPCYISFPTYNSGVEMWIPKHKDQKPTGGHAMTVVGYTKNSFIIRNSWGRDWGDNGYCYYSFDDFGAHWEIWTMVDEDSTKIEYRKDSIITKLLHIMCR